MEAFIAELLQPGSWNQTQWLAVSIAAFVLVASIYFVIRLIQIFRGLGKSTYKPNIGMARLKEQGWQPSKPKPGGERGNDD